MEMTGARCTYRRPCGRRPRSGLAALVCLILAALVVWADRAWPGDVTLLAGAGVTRGLGEQAAPAPEVSVRAAGRHVAVEGSYYHAAKLESGRGFGARAAVELRSHGIGAGLAYSYRDGGAWAKRYPWARMSYERGPVMLVGERALGGYNRETKLEVRLRGRAGRLVLEPRVFWERHIQGQGFGSALLVGIEMEALNGH